MRRLASITSALLVAVLAAPAIAQVTDEDIERARQEVNRILADSDELGRDVQEAWARQFALEHEIETLRSSIDFARAQIIDAQRRLQEAAVELYIESTSATSIRALLTVSDEEFRAAIGYLEEVSGDEDQLIDQLLSFQSELDRQTFRLEEARAEQEVLASELEAMAIQLQEELVTAQAVYDDLVERQAVEEEARRRAEEEARRQAEEEARRAAEEAARTTTTTVGVAPTTELTAPTTSTSSTTQPPTTTTTISTTTTTTQLSTTTTSTPTAETSGGAACPVAGAVSFSDTWGAPRSGGRGHQGVDMIAARGTPIVAIYNGTIKRITNGNLSGLALWLRVDNGDEFFYAHLDGFGEISEGQRVSSGQTIGFNGSTGNAPEWLPHLHLEFHPGGGSAINPYPLVKSICG